MPIIKSAKKRVRTAHKATARNRKTKRSYREAIKLFSQSLTGNKSKVADAHRKAQSEISKAGKKNVMHKNKVARKQRQLAKAAKTAGVPIAVKSATKKATPAKKPVAKKPAAKKK